MSTVKLGDIVAAIKKPGGFTRYVTVGALLEHGKNDATKGPGFSIVFDPWINPAGLPRSPDGSVFLSVYHPKVRNEQPDTRQHSTTSNSPPGDDDIPF